MFRTLALSWLMIFNLRESIVPSFISDSKTSSGVISEDDAIETLIRGNNDSFSLT